MIELRLLGGFDVLGPDGARARAVLAQPRRAALLAYLVTRVPRGPERRDRLVQTFWPQADPVSGRQSLRQALSFLRRALGERIIVTQGDVRGEEEVGVDPAEVRCDAVTLEALLDAGDLRGAAELYRGELLQGFSPTGIRDFERWLEETRDRHRSRMRAALRRLAEQDAVAGNRPLAAIWARRQHELDRTDEESAMHLMRRLAAEGDGSGALAVYGDVVRLLASELDDEPSPELVALGDEVRAMPEPAAAPLLKAMEPARSAAVVGVVDGTAAADRRGARIEATGAEDPRASVAASLVAGPLADPPNMVPLRDVAAVPTRSLQAPASFRTAVALYAAAVIVVAVVAVVAKAAIGGIRLPDWVFPGTLAVMGLGLPVVLFTGYVRWVAQCAAATTLTHAPAAMQAGRPAALRGAVERIAFGASPHLSWGRTARWGTAGLTAFVVLVAGVMALRAVGVAPFGTLFAAGTLKADDAIVVADFASPGDSTLGRAVTEGVKVDFAQSRAVRLLGEEAVAAVLRRMRRPGDHLTLPIAREVAMRAGAEMVIDGSIVPLGPGFLLTLRLVTADSGHTAVGYQASVDSPGEVVGAVGKLTRRLRARIGESLREVQGSPRLEDVTTSSLDALRRYTDGRRALGRDGDRPRFVRLMREAIALDSTFAAAYLWLAAELDNRGGHIGEVARLLVRAYALRERLPSRDQRWIESFYFQSGPPAVRDSARVLAAALAQAADPADRDRANTLNNLGFVYHQMGRRASAESVYRLAIAADTTYRYPLSNLINLLEEDGNLTSADSLVPVFRRRFPKGYTGVLVAAALLRGRGDLDGAEAVVREALAGTDDPFSQTEYAAALALTVGMAGRIRDFDAAIALMAAARRARGVATADLDAALDRASFHALVVGDRAGARRILDSANVERAAGTMDPLDRPDAAAALAYALAGDASAARRHLAGVERQIPERDLGRAYLLRVARANVALAERRWDDAIREARLARVGRCSRCGELPLALAYDSASARDSAIAVFERTRVGVPMRRYVGTFAELAAGPVLRRLGGLYEAKGDTARAIDRYERFVAIWQRADPELQPQVAEIRTRIARLQARRGRTR